MTREALSKMTVLVPAVKTAADSVQLPESVMMRPLPLKVPLVRETSPATVMSPVPDRVPPETVRFSAMVRRSLLERDPVPETARPPVPPEVVAVEEKVVVPPETVMSPSAPFKSRAPWKLLAVVLVMTRSPAVMVTEPVPE